MQVLVSGLTAAGKTTLCSELARRLGYDYISAGSVLARMAGEESGIWTTSVDSMRVMDDSLDRRVDEILLERFNEPEPPCVFDSWALPWLVDGHGCMRIWLESDLESRVRKCAVSRLMRGYTAVEIAECRAVVESKDEFSRRKFLELHGFDLYFDHAEFDVLLDNSSTLPEPTIACARRGISMFSDLVADIVAAKLGDDTDTLIRLQANHSTLVRRLVHAST